MAKAPQVEYRIEQGIQDAAGDINSWRPWDSYTDAALARKQYAKCSAPTKRLIATIILEQTRLSSGQRPRKR